MRKSKNIKIEENQVEKVYDSVQSSLRRSSIKYFIMGKSKERLKISSEKVVIFHKVLQ